MISRTQRLSYSEIPALVLAAGKGSRLHELTAETCKPGLAFGRDLKLIDFTLSNAVNSGLRHFRVATSYRPLELHEHLIENWVPRAQMLGGSLVIGEGTAAQYVGTAAAAWHNMEAINSFAPEYVMVLAADHIYQMDFGPMIEAHRASGAAVTIAAQAVPVEDAKGFGILQVDEMRRVLSFSEKPAQPVPMPAVDTHALASMGIYVFSWRALSRALIYDMANPKSGHDFGRDVLPLRVGMGEAFVFQHSATEVEGGMIQSYWRDVGTLDGYRESYLECFHSPEPLFNAAAWPLFGAERVSRPGAVRNVIPALAPKHVHTGRPTLITATALFPGATVHAGARLLKTIIGPHAKILAGLVIGEDPIEDAKWFRRTPKGTVLVTQDMLIEREESRRRIYQSRVPDALATSNFTTTLQ
jgi:glucose-1-phosphate adenylyltransferase